MPAKFESAGAGRFTVTGPMTFESAGDLLRQSASGLAAPERIEVDLGQVSESDSAGLALLIEWKRLAVQRGAPIRFTNMPPQLSALARISEVDELLADAPVAVAEQESA